MCAGCEPPTDISRIRKVAPAAFSSPSAAEMRSASCTSSGSSSSGSSADRPQAPSCSSSPAASRPLVSPQIPAKYAHSSRDAKAGATKRGGWSASRRSVMPARYQQCRARASRSRASAAKPRLLAAGPPDSEQGHLKPLAQRHEGDPVARHPQQQRLKRWPIRAKHRSQERVSVPPEERQPAARNSGPRTSSAPCPAARPTHHHLATSSAQSRAT